ncbi:MAG TPA: HypC/HybG/HupF family hydrogenase formation chaperone [Acidimicrobiales bacterium]|nr:HypC/HybG/HupF family hydrogenase formation chaperone [Acidimicrobiales bacterium]
MCVSRLHLILELGDDATAEVADLDGACHRVSFLAFEGPEPEPGDWIVVHAGYALEPADPVEADAAATEYRRAVEAARRRSSGHGTVAEATPGGDGPSGDDGGD